MDQVVPNWDGLAGAFPAPAQGEPAAFLPWLAAEWGIAQFDRYFDDVPALIANGLPWLREARHGRVHAACAGLAGI